MIIYNFHIKHILAMIGIIEVIKKMFELKLFGSSFIQGNVMRKIFFAGRAVGKILRDFTFSNGTYYYVLT